MNSTRGVPRPAIDQSGMRRLNAVTTLRLLVDAPGAVTSAHLVSRTGLSRRTIELITADLIEAGWAAEVDRSDGQKRAGRPKKYFQLVPERALVLAVTMHESTLTAHVADLRGHVLSTSEMIPSAAATPQQTLQAALDAGEAAMASGGFDRARLTAVAVAVSGTVSSSGVMRTSPQDASWAGVDVRTPFAERFDVPVVVENDTNLTALAEQSLGAARDAPTFVLIKPGNRISAGVVIDGELHRGFEGAAGELVRLPRFAAARWHEHPVAMLTSPDIRLREMARDLITRADGGDEEATRLVREFFASFAEVIAVIGWVLAPPVVVVSGAFDGIEEIGERFIAEALHDVDLPDIRLRVSAMRSDAPAFGGIRLAWDTVGERLYGAV